MQDEDKEELERTLTVLLARRRTRGRGRRLIKLRPLLLPPHYAIMIRNQSALYSAPPAILEESSVIASARDNEFIVGLCKIVDAPRASVKFPLSFKPSQNFKGLEFLVRETRCPDIQALR